MARLLLPFASAVLLVAAAGSPAQEKAAGPAGVWVRTADGVEVRLDFGGGKGSFKGSIVTGDVGIDATCRYEVRDGVVKAEVTAIEVTGAFPNPPAVGFEFGFKWAAKADTAELSALTGNIDPVARALIEGGYTRAKGAKKG